MPIYGSPGEIWFQLFNLSIVRSFALHVLNNIVTSSKYSISNLNTTDTIQFHSIGIASTILSLCYQFVPILILSDNPNRFSSAAEIVKLTQYQLMRKKNRNFKNSFQKLIR